MTAASVRFSLAAAISDLSGLTSGKGASHSAASHCVLVESAVTRLVHDAGLLAGGQNDHLSMMTAAALAVQSVCDGCLLLMWVAGACGGPLAGLPLWGSGRVAP